jgi:hypothetical protein
MKISDPISDWYIPPDWRFIFSWHLVTMVIPMLTILLLLFLARAARGDTTLLWFAVAVGGIGVILLFLARLPLYRQHKFFSFGPRALPPGRRKLYWVAYAFIGVSIAVMALLLRTVSK